MNFLNRAISINRWVFYAGFLGLFLSILLPYQYPSNDSLIEGLSKDPIQIETHKERFEYKDHEGNEIYIKPLYDYEISGLVVSDNGWGGNIFPQMLGSRIKDICIVWGNNVEDLEMLKKIKFRNDSYTCYTWWKWVDDVEFNGSQFSNNHLLSDNPIIRKKILRAKKGDQITMRGQLVEYGDAKTNRVGRISSLVRTDDGNGACETIYVEDISIVYGTPLKRFLQNFIVPIFWLSLLLKLGLGMYHVFRVSKPRSKF